MKVPVLTVIFAILFFSCTYDTEDEYYSSEICDTSKVSYSETIRPILDLNCVSCHSGAAANAGIELDTYQSVKEVAESGMLLGVINHIPGYKPMPQNLPKLDECAIIKMETWVQNGSPDN